MVVLLQREKEDGGYSPTVNVRIDKNTLGATGSFIQWMKPEVFSVFDVETTRQELTY